MSVLLHIRESLQNTAAQIARLERNVAQNPDVPLLALELESLQRRKEKLEAEFLEVSNSAGVDVCSYRLLPEQLRARLVNLAAALTDYQSLLSLFYDAIRNGPKQLAKMGADVLADTSLDFGYAFAGSFGFVLTIPNERLLQIETDLDAAVRAIFDVAKADTSAAILDYARRLGLAPIRALHRWAEDHVKGSLSADIEWRRGREVRMKAVIQKAEFDRLRQIISQTSETTHGEFEATGVLLAADLVQRSFRLQSDEGDIIKGKFTDAISQTHTVELPRRYRALISKSTTIHYSTEEEDVSYQLLRLQPA